MKPSELKKDKPISARLNQEVFEKITSEYGSIQKFIDEKCDKEFKVTKHKVECKK